IEKTDTKIEKLKCIKQGLMQDLFRYGIDENNRMRSEKTHRFKNSLLGRIPKEWEVVGIYDVCKLVNGRAFKPSEWSENGLPIIRIENLNSADAQFNYCNFRVEPKYLISNGDLLISWSGTPGTSFGIFEWRRGNAVLNQHIIKVILGNNIEKLYYYYAYVNLLDEMIRQSHGGVGLQHITKEDLKRLKILFPIKPEQSRIASVLFVADEAIEKEVAYKNKLLAVKRGLMEDLLSGKVRTNHLINNSN
ncbi:MAG: restriction endonuclease subunit S, partial [Sedimentisphaerales bacterium]|nr:restriction endonuclease subunit S [Sedimentisphaerales bacterium]